MYADDRVIEYLRVCVLGYRQDWHCGKKVDSHCFDSILATQPPTDFFILLKSSPEHLQPSAPHKASTCAYSTRDQFLSNEAYFVMQHFQNILLSHDLQNINLIINVSLLTQAPSSRSACPGLHHHRVQILYPTVEKQLCSSSFFEIYK